MKGPRLEDMSDEELDKRAEEQYAIRIAGFELAAYVAPKKKRRRNFHDYTAKNCEEAWAS